MFADAKPLIEGRPRALVVAAAVVLAATAGVVAWLSLRPSADVGKAPVPVGEPLDPARPAEALVFVSGAVVHPGLYRVTAASRVADAVAAAGGITADADPGRLPDLAARVHDGRQVNIPFLRGTRGNPGSSSALRLDINSASVDELAALPGMPVGLPQAIVESRTLWGPFATVSELRTRLEVDSATLSGLRRYLRVATVPP